MPYRSGTEAEKTNGDVRAQEGDDLSDGDADPHLSLRDQAKDLLRRQGYEVEDHWLRTREETDAKFKAEHGVKNDTPDLHRWRAGRRLRRSAPVFFGKTVADPTAVNYRPVAVVFAKAH